MSESRPRRRFRWGRWILGTLVALAIGTAFHFGIVPPRYSPLPAIDIDSASGWFIDWRLAELKHDKGLCRAVMVGDNVRARTIPDRPIRDGCGWTNAVRMTSAGQASISVGRLSCETAAAFALWMTQGVQPAARAVFGSPVKSISHMGTYSCRNIIGQNTLRRITKLTGRRFRSQHATANAIDIGAFTLANGERIVLARHWKGSGKRAEFLRRIHQSACRYFRVSLSPDYNKAHYNHFHFDRGPLTRCK